MTAKMKRRGFITLLGGAAATWPSRKRENSTVAGSGPINGLI